MALRLRRGAIVCARLARASLRDRAERPLHASLGLCACFATAFAIGFSRTNLVAPYPTPIVVDRYGSYLAEGDKEQGSLGFWEVEGEIPPRITLCLTAIEDTRFDKHLGIDLRSLLRAVANNLSGKSRQGASTIPMQVARLQSPAPRTFANKSREALEAFMLVTKYGRERVLRHYLKLVPQGNRIFGVAYAARRYFRKPLCDISLAEAALLASLPKAPGKMNLFSEDGLSQARERALLVLRVLKDGERIDEDDYAQAVDQLAAMSALARERRPADSYHYILRVLGEAKASRPSSYSSPLEASLDGGLQGFVSGVAAKAIEENEKNNADNVSLIVANGRTGEILAYVGSGGFFSSESAGSINYAHTPRSSGSTIKPFLFAYALDSGKFTPASVLADLPFSVLSPAGEYRVTDFDDDYLGPMLFRRALANSRNVPAMRVLEAVGMDGFYSFTREIGLERDGPGADFYGYGMAIGGLYVTLEDLVAAYGTLANDGRRFSLRWVKTQAAATGTRALSSYAARTVGLFLSDPSARYPSFPRLGSLELSFPIAVKTGTSQGYRDAWIVAYTADYIVGMWIGNHGATPMNKIPGNAASGYVAQILAYLHPLQERGIDIVPFPEPEGCVPVTICAVSGEEAGPDCPVASREWFRAQEVPESRCTVHQRLAVDAATQRLATESTPPARVALRAFTVLPPEYAVWGARRGYGPPLSEVSGPQGIRITYPGEGARFVLDPGIPPEYQTLPLQVLTNRSAGKLQWIVDGKPFALIPYPYAARYPLSHGLHTAFAWFPDTEDRSETVSFTVD